VVRNAAVEASMGKRIPVGAFGFWGTNPAKQVWMDKAVNKSR
jgi:hypothetical protein